MTVICSSIQNNMPFLPLANIHKPFTPLSDTDKHKFFHRQRAPRYQLNDLKNKAKLMDDPKYAYLVQLVEEWNQKVSQNKYQVSPLQHEKIKFIHSSLRSMALHSQCIVEQNINKLYQWHQGLTAKSTPMSLNKKGKQQKVDEQQWQIRNTYKSNLPLEIDNYNRRICFEGCNINVNNVTQPLFEKKKTGLQDQRIKQKHCAVRDCKQNIEMAALGRMMKKNKARFDHLPSRNFYQQEFHQDKVYNKRIFSKVERTSDVSDLQVSKKDVRAQTMANWNAKSSEALIKGAYSTASSNFHPQKPTQHHLGQQLPINLSFSTSQLYPASGIGLMVNPFESKSKPKRR